MTIQIMFLLLFVAISATGAAENLLSDCFGMKCWNGGTLQDTAERCKCQCPNRHSGIYCEYELQQSIWPQGPYAIPVPVDGCPETESHGWTSGFINVTTTRPLQILVSHTTMYNGTTDYMNDTEAETIFDINTNRTISPLTLGPFSTFVFQLSFCHKSKDHPSYQTHSWPGGNYEIYGSDEGCPQGFSEHNLTHHIPPVLTWNTDGNIPAMNVTFLPDGSAILQLLGCRQINNNNSVFNLSSPLWNTPFMLLKDGYSACTIFEDFTTEHETIFIAMIIDDLNLTSRNVVMEHCYYTPNDYTYDELTSEADYEAEIIVLSECYVILGVHMRFPGMYARVFKNVQSIFNQGEVRRDIDWLGLPDQYQAVDQLPWLLFDLGQTIDITHVLIVLDTPSEWRINRFEKYNAMLTYTDFHDVYISESKWSFLNYGAEVVRYNTYSIDNRIFKQQFVRPGRGRYMSYIANKYKSNTGLMQFHVRLNNMVAMKCSSANDQVVQMNCNRELGMTGGMIDSFQITASSWQPGYPPELARLFHAGWCADTVDIDPFLQIDLLIPTTLEGVTVFNWNKQTEVKYNNVFVLESEPMGCRSFHLTYGTNLDSFYGTSRQYRLDLSRQYEDPHQFLFKKPFLARYVRIHPEPLLNINCLKVELVGCKTTVVTSLFCENGTTMQPMNVSRTFVSVYEPIYLFDGTKSTWSDCMTACINISNDCSSFQHQEDNICIIYKPSHSYNYQELVNEPALGTLTTFVCRKESAEIKPKIAKVSLDDPNDRPYSAADIEDEEVITSTGYPFHYELDQIYQWHIHFKEGEFIKLIVSNLSLHVYENIDTGGVDDTDGCIDKLVIQDSRKQMSDVGVKLDNRDNSAMMTFATNMTELFLTFTTCITNRMRIFTGNGFRAIVTKTVIPNCLGLYRHEPFYCEMPMMTLASDSFYNHKVGDPGGVYLQKWIIQGNDTLPIILTIIEIDVECDKGTLFTIHDPGRDGNGVSTYCNTKKPVQFLSIYNTLTLEYTQQNNWFFEGFRASYEFSLENKLILKTYRNMTICSMQLQKCYVIYASSSSSKNNSSWEAAQKECESRDSHLVTIHTRLELQFLRILIDNFMKQNLTELENNRFSYHLLSNIDPDLYLHIGLSHYIDADGILQEIWIDGSPLTFTAWNFEEPVDVKRKQCTRLRFDQRNKDSTWESEECSTTGTGSAAYYICETFITELLTKASHNLRNDTKTPTEMPTEKGRFYQCKSGDWISIIAKCDGIPDCFDRSDEINCNHIDKDEWFMCSDGGIIHMSEVCNYIPDCLDESDEYCVYPACNENQFQCTDRQCIPPYSRCDAVPDCFDGSDEINCVSCNETMAFACSDLRCIALSQVCDQSKDCKDGQDELSCEQTTYSTCQGWYEAGYKTNGVYLLDMGEVECRFEEYLLVETVRLFTFIHSTQRIDCVYDGNVYRKINDSYFIQSNFPENEQCDQKVSLTCRPGMWEVAQYDGVYKGISFSGCLCHSTVNLSSELSMKYHCDVLQDLNYVKYNHSYYYLTYKQYARNIRFLVEPVVCEKELDITETERNMACEREQKTISEAKRCLYDLDWSGKIDGCNSLTHLEGCEKYECPSGYLKCPGSFCIPYRFVCDGQKHCVGGEDEIKCWCKETENEKIIVYSADTSTEKLIANVYKLARQLYSPASTVRVVELSSRGFNPNSTKTVFASSSEVFLTERVVDSKHQALKMYQAKQNRINKSEIINHLIKVRERVITTLGIVHIQHRLDAEVILKVPDSPIQPIREGSIILYNVAIDPNIYKKVEQIDSSFIKNITIRTQDDIGNIGSTLFPEICTNHDESICYMQYRCTATRVCLPLSQVCDGLKQCIHGDDEHLCDFTCPEKCSCRGFINCKDFKTSNLKDIPLKTRLLDLSFNGNLSGDAITFQDTLFFLHTLNISTCQLGAIPSNLFIQTPNMRTLDISYNSIKHIQNKAFESLTLLRTFVLFGNHQLQSIEAGAFEGLTNLQQLSITGTQLTRIVADTFTGMGSLLYLDLSNNRILTVEDFSFRNLDVETIDVKFNDITDFSNDMFTGVISVKNIISPAYKICCIRPVYVDEIDCLPHKDEFSSCKDLMRNPNLQALLWVIGIAALLGNILSLIYRLKFDRKRLKLGYGIFVTNLAVADFLMGVYLIIIATADLVFRNRYIWMDEYWRNSHMCNMAGILSTMSSEASVAFICLITIDRVLVIKYPFGQVRFRARSASIASLVAWAFVIIIAFIPIVYGGYFQNKFYTKSGVCLALPLTRDRPPGWVYSITIFIGLNFVTFALIAVGQCMLYYEIRSNTRKMKRSVVRKNDLSIARNLLLVVTTDFLCWFPIGVMGMMAMTGHVISGDVYAWTAVLVLPINSAINPFLYTASAILASRKFAPDTEEQSRLADTNTHKGLVKNILKLLNSRYFCSNETDVEINISAEVYVREKKLSIIQLTQITMQLLRCVSCLHKCEMVIGQSIPMEMVTLCFQPDGETFSHIKLEMKPNVCLKSSEIQMDVYEVGALLRKLLTETEV